MLVRAGHLGILVIAAASIPSWSTHGTVSAALRSSFRHISDSTKASADSPKEEILFETEAEDDEEEGSYNGASSTGDNESDEPDFSRHGDSSAQGSGSDAKAAAEDVHSKDSGNVDENDNEEQAPAVLSEFEELDSLLQSARLDNELDASESSGSSSSDNTHENIASNLESSSNQDRISTTATTTATITDMKAILKAAGIAPAKLDSFLDRESLVDYFTAYQKLHKQRQHLASATGSSSSSSSSSTFGTPNSGRSDVRSNYTQQQPPQSALSPEVGWQPPTGKPPKAPPVVNARVEGPPTSVVLLGEHHSGVAWVAELFHLNAPGWKVLTPPGLTRHAHVAGPEVLDFEGANNTLILLVTKDPFAWAVSMHDREPGNALAPLGNNRHHYSDDGNDDNDGDGSTSNNKKKGSTAASRYNVHASKRANDLARRKPHHHEMLQQQQKKQATSPARWWQMRRAAKPHTNNAYSGGSLNSGNSRSSSGGGGGGGGSSGGHSAASVGRYKAAKAERVSADQRNSLTSFLGSRWMDTSTLTHTTAQGHTSALPPVEYPSVMAMRTAKLNALFDALQHCPHLRFAALKFEDLLDDSEASLRVVLTRFGVNPLPWRNEHFWRERKPTDHEWFDLEESHHAHERPHWHKSREYYLQRHRVMKRYDAASAFALRKHLNGSLEAFLGHDHPLASDSITEEAVHDYFQRGSLLGSALSWLLRNVLHGSALLMTVPLAILMALFLPCALLYGHRARQLYGFDEGENTNSSGPRVVRSRGKRVGGIADKDSDGDEVEFKEEELFANTLKAFPSSMSYKSANAVSSSTTSGLRSRRKQNSQLDRGNVPGHSRTASPSSHVGPSRREALSLAAEARAFAAAAAAAETDPNQLVPVTAAEVARAASTSSRSRNTSPRDRSSSPSLLLPPPASTIRAAPRISSSVSPRSLVAGTAGRPGVNASSASARAAAWVNRARHERQQQRQGQRRWRGTPLSSSSSTSSSSSQYRQQQGASMAANPRNQDEDSNSDSDMMSDSSGLDGYMNLYGMGGDGSSGGGGLGPVVVNPQTALRGRRLYGSAK